MTSEEIQKLAPKPKPRVPFWTIPVIEYPEYLRVGALAPIAAFGFWYVTHHDLRWWQAMLLLLGILVACFTVDGIACVQLNRAQRHPYCSTLKMWMRDFKRATCELQEKVWHPATMIESSEFSIRFRVIVSDQGPRIHTYSAQYCYNFGELHRNGPAYTWAKYPEAEWVLQNGEWRPQWKGSPVFSGPPRLRFRDPHFDVKEMAENARQN